MIENSKVTARSERKEKENKNITKRTTRARISNHFFNIKLLGMMNNVNRSYAIDSMNYIKAQCRSSCPALQYLTSIFFFFFVRFFSNPIKIHSKWIATIHSLLRWIFKYLSEVTEQTLIFKHSIRFDQFLTLFSFDMLLRIGSNILLVLACHFLLEITFKMGSVGLV